MKKLGGLLSAWVLLMGAVAVVGPASPAAAATGSCSGSLVDRRPLNYGGSTIGELVVYFNGSTGQNCARMNHLGATYNRAYRTVVFLAACTETNPSTVCHYRGTPVVDDGTYALYAGPVRVSAAGRCIHAAGDIYYAGAKRHVETTPAASHCG